MSKHEFSPDYCVPPGATIAECLKERNWTHADFAYVMGVPVSQVHRLIVGRKKITIELSRNLEAALGVPASFWMNRENAYRLHLSRGPQQQGSEG